MKQHYVLALLMAGLLAGAAAGANAASVNKQGTQQVPAPGPSASAAP